MIEDNDPRSVFLARTVAALVHGEDYDSDFLAGKRDGHPAVKAAHMCLSLGRSMQHIASTRIAAAIAEQHRGGFNQAHDRTCAAIAEAIRAEINNESDLTPARENARLKGALALARDRFDMSIANAIADGRHDECNQLKNWRDEIHAEITR